MVSVGCLDLRRAGMPPRSIAAPAPRANGIGDTRCRDCGGGVLRASKDAPQRGRWKRPATRVRPLVLPDAFTDQAKPERMYELAGLDAPGIVRTVFSALGTGARAVRA